MATQLTATIDVESNPYPTGIGSAGFFDMASLVETIRQQHQHILAGDTTLPWSHLSEINDQEIYRRGAVGRFYHPDYGIIKARYVRFDSLVVGDTGLPVGWFLNNPAGFTWMATTDFALSGNDHTIGLMASYVTVESEQFGWVIEEGINTQSVIYAGVGVPVLGQDLQWNATGLVGSGGGRTLGKVMSTTGIVALGGGQWRIPPAAILIGWR